MHQGVGRSLGWMLTAQVGQFGGMLSFGVVSDRLGMASTHPAAFWAAMLVLGVGSGCTAGFGALLAEIYPTEVRGTAMGATYNLARAAQLGAPLLVGWAVGWGGLRAGLSVPLLLALATASWVWVLPETRGIDLPSMRAAD